jgi:P27 family predicted phage terminase small subunit
MARGRKARPPELKVLRGERKERIPQGTPSRVEGEPEAPGNLEGEALAEWGRVVAELKSMGVLSRTDRAILVRYTTAWDRHRMAVNAIKRYGLVVKSAGGSLKSNPATNLANQCDAIMLRCLAEMGLSPASRGKVKVAEPPKDALGEFLSRRSKGG